MGRMIAAIDAITEDIENHVELERPYALWKYGRPPALTAEATPMLNVSLGATTWRRLTTGAGAGEDVHEPRAGVTVRWIISAADRVQYAGAGDPTVIADLAQTLDAIAERCKRYGDGIVGVGGVFANLTETHISPEEGAIWIARAELVVVE